MRLLRAILALFCFLVALLLAQVASAADVTIAWDPNPPEEQVTKYIVYWGFTSRTHPSFAGYDNQTDVGDIVQWLVDIGDEPQPRYVAVTACNSIGLCSEYSDELKLAGVSKPVNVRKQ